MTSTSISLRKQRENLRHHLTTSQGIVLTLLLCSLSVSGAEAHSAQVNETVTPAVLITDPLATKVVALPEPLPLPGQLKAITHRHASGAERQDPKGRVNMANRAARMQPVREGFINAIQHYPFTDGALYQLYAAPGEITDIVLQEGEQLTGAGPVAAGDTVRWIIGDTSSGAGTALREHILVKPTRTDLVTNLVINTDRRSYHIEMHSTPSTYMASLSWDYPQDALIAIRGANAAAARVAPIASGIDAEHLNFDYTLSGDSPSWKPERVFDDGTRVFVEFPESVAQGDMPPLFVIGTKGGAELVNYRVEGRHMIVDKLFSVAELRLGDKKSTQVVRITRVAPRTHRGFHL